MRTVVVGVGNRFRSDDAVGLEVAARLRGALPGGVRVVDCEGEPVALLDAIADADLAIVVDATSSGSAAGEIHRVEATERELPHAFRGSSTHVLGLAEAIELGRALGRLPGRTVVYGVEGASFEAGERLSAEVDRAAGLVAAEILRAVGEEA